MTTKFKAGDFVWAKLRFSSFWPAKVVNPPTGNKSYYVSFFETDNFGWVKESNICSYPDNDLTQPTLKNKSYQNAVKKIAEAYQEHQLNSAAEKDEEKDGDFQENIYDDYIIPPKPKRTKEEEEERRRKIQERLKVRMFPKGTKHKINKKVRTKKQKKSTVKAASHQSVSKPSSNSAFLTINVRDYKNVIHSEPYVLLHRYQANYPCLKCGLQPECDGDDQPPILEAEM